MRTRLIDEDERKFNDRFRRKLFINQYLKQLGWLVNTVNPKTVISLGCGDGYPDRHVLVKFPLLVLTGIDKDKNKIEKAKILNPPGNYIVDDILTRRFKADEYDLVMCLQVLEHFTNYDLVVRKIKEASKYAIISVPWEPWFSLLSLLGLRNLKHFGRHPDHVNFWSPVTFKNTLRKHFTSVKIYRSFPWLFALCGDKD